MKSFSLMQCSSGNPLITVIMPLKYYNPDFLRKAILSITGQSCPDWNLTIVVESSDRRTFEVLLETELRDPRIRLIVNAGFQFPGAINTGIKTARTEFVAILLCDDMWSLDAVEVLNRYILENSEIDFFHSSRIVVDEQDKPISSVFPSRDSFRLSDFISGSPVKHLLCWKKEKSLQAGGIDEAILKAQDDYDFPWTMAENGANFKAVKECLYYYRNHNKCERLTTHRPLSVTKRGIRGIMKKHGVGFFKRIWIVERMTRSGNLGSQCIYRNRFDRWLAERFHVPVTRRWHQEEYK